MAVPGLLHLPHLLPVSPSPLVDAIIEITVISTSHVQHSTQGNTSNTGHTPGKVGGHGPGGGGGAPHFCRRQGATSTIVSSCHQEHLFTSVPSVCSTSMVISPLIQSRKILYKAGKLCIILHIKPWHPFILLLLPPILLPLPS